MILTSCVCIGHLKYSLYLSRRKREEEEEEELDAGDPCRLWRPRRHVAVQRT
jgi:hypothetical protein